MSQNDLLEFWTEENFLISERVIYLGSATTDTEGDESGVDAAMARRFEIGMRALEYFDPTAPITIIMNNPGGDYYHGMAIYDRIMESRCRVTIQASGYVMSMGALILQAADKRLLSRNATLLLHYGSSSHSGHSIDHERSGEESRRIRIIMEQIYLDKMLRKDPKMTLQKVRQYLQFDEFIDASRAIRLGLGDGFIPQPKHKKVKTRIVNPSE